MEYGDWVEAEVFIFTVGSVGLVWLPKEVLAPPGEVRPTQGFLRPGSKAWPEFETIGTGQPEVATFPMRVGLREEKDGYVMVTGAVGLAGAWIIETGVKAFQRQGHKPEVPRRNGWGNMGAVSCVSPDLQMPTSSRRNSPSRLMISMSLMGY